MDGISNADMHISYQALEDGYKYFVNGSSIRFSFKCLHATFSVLSQMGDRMAPCIILMDWCCRQLILMMHGAILSPVRFFSKTFMTTTKMEI